MALLILVVLALILVGVFLAMRHRAIDHGLDGAIPDRRNDQDIDHLVAEWCRVQGVPNVSFDLDRAIRDALAGIRPDVPRDGQWWIAVGTEGVGRPSLMRLMDETVAPDRAEVMAGIDRLFAQFGGRAVLPPSLPEGRFLGTWPGEPDIVYARITGRLRPLGAWAVAVPPWLIRARG
jgi:hypothetical protein